jgi:hypothetical protein
MRPFFFFGVVRKFFVLKWWGDGEKSNEEI